MSALDHATAGLVRVACGIPDASEAALADLIRAARAAGASTVWIEELVLSSVLFVGFPRALVAAAALRAVEPGTGEGADAADYDRWREWLTRGEETGRRIYGEQFDRLRRNVAALHPALDLWIVVDGYGRTIGRPALDMTRRELCAIAMLVPQNASRQLHSHLRGALNVGATPEQVAAVLALAGEVGLPGSRVDAALALWYDVTASANSQPPTANG